MVCGFIPCKKRVLISKIRVRDACHWSTYICRSQGNEGTEEHNEVFQQSVMLQMEGTSYLRMPRILDRPKPRGLFLPHFLA